MPNAEASDFINIWTNVDGEHKWRLEMRVALFDPNFEPKYSYRADEIQELLETPILREYGIAILSRLGVHHWVTTYLSQQFPYIVEFTFQDMEPKEVELIFKELIDEMSKAMLFTHWDFPTIRYLD